MLRHIVIQNFVHFQERQHLDFDNGPNFIIGGNSTGKSSIFELTRRCLSRKLSKTYSSISDNKKLALALCEFELCTELAQDFRELENLKFKKNWRPYKFYSGILVENQNGKMYKFVNMLDSSTKTNDVSQIFLESSKYQIEKRVESDGVESKGDESEVEAREIEDESEKFEAAKYIENIISKKEDDSDERLLTLFRKTRPVKVCGETPCETVLDILRNKCAYVFPTGSATQWSHSKSFKKNQSFANLGSLSGDVHQEKTDNEILDDLLNSDKVDKPRAKDIFWTLTAPFEYEFKKENDGLYIVTYNEVNNPLLKAPEGIKKAQQFALLLAHTEYKTIYLDEPDLGMHPHMVEKMRDLVLRSPECNDKVIIFISHNPSMISTWTLARTHVCRRSDKPSIVHRVIKVNDDRNNIGMLLRHEMKNILFASSVMFVEGMTDKLVISSVFDDLLKSGIDKMEESKLKGLKNVICGTQILAMEGQTHYRKCSQVTKELDVPCMFVEDKDVFFERKKDSPPTPSKKRKISSPTPSREENIPLSTTSRKQKNKTHFKLIRSDLLFLCKTKSEEERSQRIEQMKKRDSSGEVAADLQSFTFEQPGLIDRIQAFFNKHVYLLDGEPTAKRLKSYLDEEVAGESLRTKLQQRNVFYWETGNLEDIICESIITSESKEMSTEEDKLNLLFEIFCVESDQEKDDATKKVHKTSLLNMDKKTVEKLSSCLKNSTEMRNLFEFLLKVSPLQ